MGLRNLLLFPRQIGRETLHYRQGGITDKAYLVSTIGWNNVKRLIVGIKTKPVNQVAEKFQGKYQVASARLQHWDYGSEGAYFITICTKNRVCYFGEIEEGKMKYSPIGAMAYVLWNELPHRVSGIELGEFVVMPNHIHGVIMITESVAENNFIVKNDTTVETRHALSLQIDENDSMTGKQRFQNQGKNTISSIVGGYKSALTKYANRLALEFAWQPRFYDHIIREEKALENISQYILHNPLNWEADKFYIPKTS